MRECEGSGLWNGSNSWLVATSSIDQCNQVSAGPVQSAKTWKMTFRYIWPWRCNGSGNQSRIWKFVHNENFQSEYQLQFTTEIVNYVIDIRHEVIIISNYITQKIYTGLKAKTTDTFYLLIRANDDEDKFEKDHNTSPHSPRQHISTPSYHLTQLSQRGARNFHIIFAK